MTREEAKKQIEVFRTCMIVDKAESHIVEALNLAVEALEQEPCEDAISRAATVERLCKLAEFMNEKRDGLGEPYIMAALFIQDNKDEFPSVSPARPIGEWIKETLVMPLSDSCKESLMCSECGTHWEYNFDFCPNCGADMKGGEKDG